MNPTEKIAPLCFTKRSEIPIAEASLPSMDNPPVDKVTATPISEINPNAENSKLMALDEIARLQETMFVLNHKVSNLLNQKEYLDFTMNAMVSREKSCQEVFEHHCKIFGLILKDIEEKQSYLDKLIATENLARVNLAAIHAEGERVREMMTTEYDKEKAALVAEIANILGKKAQLLGAIAAVEENYNNATDVIKQTEVYLGHLRKYTTYAKQELKIQKDEINIGETLLNELRTT